MAIVEPEVRCGNKQRVEAANDGSGGSSTPTHFSLLTCGPYHITLSGFSSVLLSFLRPLSRLAFTWLEPPYSKTRESTSLGPLCVSRRSASGMLRTLFPGSRRCGYVCLLKRSLLFPLFLQDPRSSPPRSTQQAKALYLAEALMPSFSPSPQYLWEVQLPSPRLLLFHRMFLYKDPLPFFCNESERRPLPASLPHPLPLFSHQLRLPLPLLLSLGQFLRLQRFCRGILLSL